MIFLLIRTWKIRSHRLTVRTGGFQSPNRGSIPRGTAKNKIIALFNIYLSLIFSDKPIITDNAKKKNIALLVVKKLPDDLMGKISRRKI